MANRVKHSRMFNFRVDEKMYRQLSRAVKKYNFFSNAEFIRIAIKEKLEREGTNE